MAPPPLDRQDLRDRTWRSRPSSFIRLPRRTRRATYLCWASIILIFYLLLRSLTSFSVPSTGLFDYKAPQVAIRFPNLYQTIYRFTSNRGNKKWNRRVIFAADSLEAASKLVPIACEMSQFNRNDVHFVFMGFDTLSIEDFRRLNGIADEESDCRIIFHDARPEYAELLAEERRQLSVKIAFRHICDSIHPQAVLVDASAEEDWFLKIAREKVKQLETTLIELPKHAADDMRWITRLDSGSLNAWHKPSYEVLLYADGHSGNLERLLKSLKKAHYPSPELFPIHLTIVLDPSSPVSPLTLHYLESYDFPSRNQITIKRPLTPHSEPTDAAIHFVESFYPANKDRSLLVLNTNTELSPWAFHYLYFATLEYRYSHYQPLETDTIFGISLEEPASYLSGDIPFAMPTEYTPFLYGAPTRRAALYFPRHWAEFHSYFAHKLRLGEHSAKTNGSLLSDLSLSKDIIDSWLPPLIELVRARGYTMLYPFFKHETLAIVHNEIPSFTNKAHGYEKPLMEKNNILDELPNGDLPHFDDLPIFDLSGNPTRLSLLETAAMKYRLSISTCPETKYVSSFEVGDLFCDEYGESIP